MITKIILKNFRGHKETALEFGPGKNVIRGRNEIGKTTINEAISFGFYGCDQFSKTADHLITYGEEACEVTIQTNKATFVRSKKRGLTPSVQLIRGDIPPIKMNQTELQALLGISFEVFGSCYNVGFFMNLPDNKKMEVIGQIAKVDRAKLLSSLMPRVKQHSKVKLENLRVDLQVMGNERRLLQNQLAADQGGLAQVELQKKSQKELHSLDLEAVQGEIKTLTAQVDLFDFYQMDLHRYRDLLIRNDEQKVENEKISEEKKRLELEYQSLGDLNALSKKRDELHLKIESLEKKEAALLSEIEPLPQLPAFLEIPEGNCSRCGQVVPQKLRESAEREREQSINSYNEKAREIQTRNTDRQTQAGVLKNELYDLKVTLSDYHHDLRVGALRRKDIQKRITELHLKEIRPCEPPSKPEGNESAVRARLIELKGQLHAYQLGQKQRDQLKSQEEMLAQSVSQKMRGLEEVKRFEEALAQMPELEVKQTLELLQTRGVLINLAQDEFVVTDEKLVPYQSLSTGRRMKISLELCKTFQKLVPRAPQFYFLDNVDLMDDYSEFLPERAQVFIAKVDPKVDSLQIVALS